MLDSKTQYRRIFAMFGLVWGLCHATGAQALGFGEIRVSSALNEPLEARIELVSVSDSERNSLAVRVAAPDMFERFGITRTALADALNIEVTDGSAPNSVLVRLTTRRPVREPFLRFLLEADSASGRALREYTVLLDPPGQAPATTVAAPQESRRARRAPAPSTTPANRDPIGSSTRNYGPVAAGDTLFEIAARLRRPGTTVEQMQVALYNENPQAFGGNMDLLLQGTTLSIPELARVTAIDAATARETVQAQRRQARPEPPQSQPSAPAPAEAVAQADPAPTTGARLRLEAPRVAEPDNTISGATNSGTADFGRLVEPDFAAFAAAPSDTASSAPESDEQSSNTRQETVGDVQQAENGAADAVSTAAGDSSSAVAGADGDASMSPDLAAVQDVAASGDSVLFSPRNVLLLVAVVALGALLLLAYRRRQYKPVPLDSGGNIDQRPDEADSRVDAAIVEAGAAPSREMPADAAPDMAAAAGDIAPQLRVQDADRQMKIGLFDQARRTLEQGLSAQPDNSALQDKLLELDYLSGDVSGFARDVDRFRTALVGSGVRWAGVAAMGRILLPDDPRFAYGAAPGQVRPAAEPPVDFAPIGESPSSHAYAPSEESSPSQAPDDPVASDGYDETPALPPLVDDEAPEASSLEADEAESAEPASSLDSGEDLLEDGDNAIDDGLAETVSGAPVPAPWQEDPEPEDDDDLRLDTEPADLGGYDWQPQDIADGDSRQHDRGEEPGMSFDLDSSSDPAGTDESAQTSMPIEEASTTASLPPIDSSEFDLDADEEETGTDTGDEDAVEIRLDLARMYIEMQDHAAARELLEEALEEGDDAQRENARTLLAQVG